MKKPTLRSRVFDLFDVFIPEGTSTKAAVKELDRRGKIDNKKLFETLLLIVDELEQPQTKK